MTDIKSLRQSTLNAATAARDAGMITPQQFARMTDGTVSLADVSLARDLVMRSVTSNDNAGAIAQELNRAVAAQNKAQGVISNITEAVKDGVLGGAAEENRDRVMRGLK